MWKTGYSNPSQRNKGLTIATKSPKSVDPTVSELLRWMSKCRLHSELIDTGESDKSRPSLPHYGGEATISFLKTSLTLNRSLRIVERDSYCHGVGRSLYFEKPPSSLVFVKTGILIWYQPIGNDSGLC